MSRSHRGRLARAVLAFAMVGAAFAVLTTSASAAVKTFSLSITTPTSVGAGTTASYSATVTNESGGTLDSVTLTAPTGFVLTSPGKFDGLGLGIGDSAPIGFTARTPCAAANPYLWTARGDGANHQTYVLNTATSSRSTTVTGNCSLAFSPVGSGEKGAILSTKNYKAIGEAGASAVTVELRDTNNLVTLSGGSATVGLTLSSNQGALSGGSANLSNGVATFSSLSVSQSSLAYTLNAHINNSNITDGTSNTFQIWDKDIKCPDANTPCAGSHTAGNLTTDPNATFDTPDGILVSYGVNEAPCTTDAYVAATHLPETVTVNSESGQFDSDWTVTFTVSKQYDQSQAQNGSSFYQICLTSTKSFPTLDGVPNGEFDVGSTHYYYGLVQNSPQCTDPAPCVLSKTKSRTGVVIIVLRLEAGDPWTH